jgi:MscS family membrane protein
LIPDPRGGRARWLLLALVLLATAHAQQAGDGPPAGLSTPRATIATFLGAMEAVADGDQSRMEQALQTMDLEDVNPLVRNERGSDLAWMLREVMVRSGSPNLNSVPAWQQGPPYVYRAAGGGVIRVSRQADGRWLFDRQTVASLPRLMDGSVGAGATASQLPWHLRLRAWIPQSMKQSHFLLEDWQWLALLVLILLGLTADRLMSMLLSLMVRRWRRRTAWEELREVPPDTLRPLGLMIMALVWWAGVSSLGLPDRALLILLLAVKFLATLSGVWTAYRLVDLVSIWLDRHAQRTANRLDDALLPLIPRTLKIFVTVIGAVFIADNLNLNITGLLAGLGLGGLAFALAAKDLVQNLFGSVTVLLDGNFSVGDWIKVGDVEGTVERIGFRSTRIRTFYNSRVTVPNSLFITASVDNLGERTYRRLSCRLSLPYDTDPERIDAFCEGVRELIRQHPYTRKDYFHVYLNNLADSGLEVLLYVFWRTPDWGTELRERHRLLTDILRLAERLGVEFAFPTRTLHLHQHETPPAGQLSSLEAGEGARVGREQARTMIAERGGSTAEPPPVTF